MNKKKIYYEIKVKLKRIGWSNKTYKISQDNAGLWSQMIDERTTKTGIT